MPETSPDGYYCKFIYDDNSAGEYYMGDEHETVFQELQNYQNGRGDIMAMERFDRFVQNTRNRINLVIAYNQYNADGFCWDTRIIYNQVWQNSTEKRELEANDTLRKKFPNTQSNQTQAQQNPDAKRPAA